MIETIFYVCVAFTFGGILGVILMACIAVGARSEGK